MRMRASRVCWLVCLAGSLELGALAGARAATGSATPAPPAKVRRYTIQQFLATTNWGGAFFSHDGKRILAGSDRTGVFNLYELRVAGGEPVQLTHSKVSAMRPLGYFPTGNRILYLSDQGGNEQTHLYVRDASGASRDLTPGSKVRAEPMGWAPDDRSFFFATNERDPRSLDVYELSVPSLERRLLFTNQGGFDPIEVSRDRRFIALEKPGSSTQDADVYVYDLQGKEVRNLTAHQGEVNNGVMAFSPDSQALYTATDEGSEFSRLVRIDLASGQRTEVLRPDWPVLGAQFSQDGRWLVVSINHDARTETRLFEAATMKPVALPDMHDADVTGIAFSQDGNLIAFYAESSRSPRVLYLYDLAHGGAPRALVHALSPAIHPEDLVDGEVVRFHSYDGLEIPGILYRPQQAAPDHKVAAVVEVHGGPGGQSRIGYHAMIQFLVNHGYAVYSINNRGSGGYGKTFSSLDDRKHGEADLDDCVASKKMLAATGWVEPDRIAILGGSYGGYMVLAALAFRPHEFTAGVDLFGVSNWVRTLQSIPSWWSSQRQALYKEMGDPAVDGEYLRRISPLFHAGQIERPLLVLQGENDPRVLKVESDEIVAAARKRGTPVEYLVFPNEGHGFARRESQEKADQATLEFLDKYLGAK